MSFFDNGIGIGIIFGGGVGVGFVVGVCICIDIAFGWGLRLTRGLPGLLGVLLLLLLFTFAGTSTIFLRSSFVGFLYLLFFGLFIFCWFFCWRCFLSGKLFLVLVHLLLRVVVVDCSCCILVLFRKIFLIED